MGEASAMVLSAAGRRLRDGEQVATKPQSSSGEGWVLKRCLRTPALPSDLADLHAVMGRDPSLSARRINMWFSSVVNDRSSKTPRSSTMCSASDPFMSVRMAIPATCPWREQPSMSHTSVCEANTRRSVCTTVRQRAAARCPPPPRPPPRDPPVVGASPVWHTQTGRVVCVQDASFTWLPWENQENQR